MFLTSGGLSVDLVVYPPPIAVLAWGSGRASLGGIKGACPAPLIGPN